jgi:hypothetical protein
MRFLQEGSTRNCRHLLQLHFPERWKAKLRQLGRNVFRQMKDQNGEHPICVRQAVQTNETSTGNLGIWALIRLRNGGGMGSENAIKAKNGLE